MNVKPGFHLIVPIAPIVSKEDQAIKTIIWKHYGGDPEDRDDHDRLDRFKFYREDREQLQAIHWKPLSYDGDDRSDPNVFQNAPVIPRLNALSAVRFKVCVPKWRQQTRKSGDEALARLYGTVSGKLSV